MTVAVRDASAYYLIGYSLPPGRGDRNARPRRLHVRALRPGLTVRARLLSGRGGGESKARPTLASLIGSPLAGGRIPLALHAVSFAAPRGGSRAIVTLEVGGAAIRFSERAGKMSASLQYRIVASDVTGRVAASESKTLEFHVSAARRDQMRESRTRLVSSLTLRPGAYRLRAAVLDAGGGEHGLVSGDLDVRRYDRGLAMSDATLASVAEARIPTMRDNLSLFETRLSGPPTSQRVFDRSDTLDVFAEVYSTAPADQVRVAVTLSREQGLTISERPAALTRENGIGGVRCYAARTRVPLAGLEPAGYRLTFAAIAGSAAIERSVFFLVR